MQKNIIFDIGFVLIIWDPDLLYCSYFKDKKAMDLFYNETRILDLNREMDMGLSFDEAIKILTAKCPHHHEPINLWKTKWKEMIGGPVKKSVAILKKLHEANYPLYGLTNWSAETFPYVNEKYDFFKCFRDVVVSGIEKVIKPHPKIYQILLQRNNLKAEDCIFIDDNLDNIYGAKQLGINVIHFENPKKLEEDLQAMGIVI